MAVVRTTEHFSSANNKLMFSFFTHLFQVSLFLTLLWPVVIDPQCEDVKTGSFYVRSRLDGSMINIDRGDSIQIERTEGANVFYKLKVTWTGPCSFELLRQFGPGEMTTANDTFQSLNPLKITIASVGKDHYISVAVLTHSFIRIDTVWLKKPKVAITKE